MRYIHPVCNTGSRTSSARTPAGREAGNDGRSQLTFEIQFPGRTLNFDPALKCIELVQESPQHFMMLFLCSLKWRDHRRRADSQQIEPQLQAAKITRLGFSDAIENLTQLNHTLLQDLRSRQFPCDNCLIQTNKEP